MLQIVENNFSVSKLLPDEIVSNTSVCNSFSARNHFLAKNTFVKFEVAFWPEMSFLLEIFFFQMNLYSFSKY